MDKGLTLQTWLNGLKLVVCGFGYGCAGVSMDAREWVWMRGSEYGCAGVSMDARE